MPASQSKHQRGPVLDLGGSHLEHQDWPQLGQALGSRGQCREAPTDPEIAIRPSLEGATVSPAPRHSPCLLCLPYPAGAHVVAGLMCVLL